MAKEKKKAEVINYAARTEEERKKALEDAITQLEKNFGKGSIMKFGQKVAVDIPVITTGALSIDIALGIGGIPKGRIVEIYGPESSGKTTLALHVVSQVQKAGGIAAYVDAEHALDPVYAKKLGVNVDEMYISQPDDGEQALEITEAMVRSGAIDIVVVDSVAALVPRAEIEGDMGASHMGLQARLMSQALRKLTGIVSRTSCPVVFINQLREKLGNYGGETTTGGRALKFYASIRIDIRRGEVIKVGDELVGSRTKIKIAKNKLAPPFKTCDVDIMYGKGISKEGDLLDLGVELKLIGKSGSWYSYNNAKIGNGRENAKKYLRENPEVMQEIDNNIRKEYGLKELTETGEVVKPAVPENEAAKSKKPAKSSKSTKKKGKEEEQEIVLDDDGQEEEEAVVMEDQAQEGSDDEEVIETVYEKMEEESYMDPEEFIIIEDE